MSFLRSASGFLLFLLLPTSLFADTVEIELGFGGGNYVPGLLDHFNRDQAVIESYNPIGLSLPGATGLETRATATGFAEVGLYSNDLLFNMFLHSRSPSGNTGSLLPFTTGASLASGHFSINDQLLGFTMGHILYFLQDRLRIVPGYGYMGSNQYYRYSINTLGFSNVTTPATVALSQNRFTNPRASASGFFLGLGVEYDWSKKFRLKSTLRYMPDSSGRYYLNSYTLSYQNAPTGGGTATELLTFQERSGRLRHTMLDLDFKLQYLVNDHVRLNTGVRYQYVYSRYSTDPTIAYLFSRITDSGGSTSGGAFGDEVEYFTDQRIYEPFSRNMGTVYFSVTLSTGRDNI